MPDQPRDSGVVPEPSPRRASSESRRGAPRFASSEWLHSRLAEFAANLHRSTPGLDRTERRLLADLKRDEIRYPMISLMRLAAIAARSTHRWHRETLPQIVRALITRERGTPERTLDIDAVFDRENDAQHVFDRAQWRFHRARSPRHQREALAAAEQQLVWTQASIDALATAPIDGELAS